MSSENVDWAIAWCDIHRAMVPLESKPWNRCYEWYMAEIDTSDGAGVKGNCHIVLLTEKATVGDLLAGTP